MLFLLFYLVFLKKHAEISRRVKPSNKEIDKKWIILLCFLIALTISLTFHLCPINGQSAGIDSSVFLYIGKRMHMGDVPYRDLFDHKGPLLFFIQYFGLFLSGESFFGVWIIELICLTLSIYFTYRILQLLDSHNTILDFLTILFSFLVIGLQLFEGGNITEEYALPAVTFFCYVFLKFIKTGVCSKWEAFFSGLGFISVCLIRINMVGVWMVGLPLITGILFFKKQVRVLLGYILWFIAGVLTILLPCILYLLATNSFSEMLRYYYLFNLDYTKEYGSGGIGSLNQLKSILYFAKSIWPVTLAVATYSLAWVKKNATKLFRKNITTLGKVEQMREACLIMLGLTTIFATMSAKNFPHYIVVLIPFFAVFLQYSLLQLNELLDKTIRWRIPSDTTADYSIYSLIFMFVVFLIIAANFLILPYTLVEATPDVTTEYLKNNTNESDNVLIVGNACYGYLNSRRWYSGKFFYQAPPINASSIALSDFTHDFEENDPKVILIPYDRYNDTTKISSMLDKKTESGIYKKEILGVKEAPLIVYRKLQKASRPD